MLAILNTLNSFPKESIDELDATIRILHKILDGADCSDEPEKFQSSIAASGSLFNGHAKGVFRTYAEGHMAFLELVKSIYFLANSQKHEYDLSYIFSLFPKKNDLQMRPSLSSTCKFFNNKGPVYFPQNFPDSHSIYDSLGSSTLTMEQETAHLTRLNQRLSSLPELPAQNPMSTLDHPFANSVISFEPHDTSKCQM